MYVRRCLGETRRLEGLLPLVSRITNVKRQNLKLTLEFRIVYPPKGEFCFSYRIGRKEHAE